jgi:protein-tyrosine phosphatase
MPVFVACLAGVGRSSTLVLAHLLSARFKDEGLEAALDFMTARRPIVRPNPEQIEAARLAAFAFSDQG